MAASVVVLPDPATARTSDTEAGSAITPRTSARCSLAEHEAALRSRRARCRSSAWAWARTSSRGAGRCASSRDALLGGLQAAGREPPLDPAGRLARARGTSRLRRAGCRCRATEPSANASSRTTSPRENEESRSVSPCSPSEPLEDAAESARVKRRRRVAAGCEQRGELACVEVFAEPSARGGAIRGLVARARPWPGASGWRLLARVPRSSRRRPGTLRSARAGG